MDVEALELKIEMLEARVAVLEARTQYTQPNYSLHEALCNVMKEPNDPTIQC